MLIFVSMMHCEDEIHLRVVSIILSYLHSDILEYKMMIIAYDRQGNINKFGWI